MKVRRKKAGHTYLKPLVREECQLHDSGMKRKVARSASGYFLSLWQLWGKM